MIARLLRVIGLAIIVAATAVTAVLIASPASTVSARSNGVRPNAAGHVTIIILDMSGSMSGNDPNGLRCSAADAYINLAGVGDDIGVIGLDNNNRVSGGPHNFELAQIWAQPTETATIRERQALIATITQHSDGCKPDGTTPTYDALRQALLMLQATASTAVTTASVVLLTDGAPFPDPQAQANAVKSELVPQFKAHHWPVDTIALGQDAIDNGLDYHQFLKDVANGTAGKPYDDGRGVVPGVSPINIAPFFLDIAVRRDGETQTAAIPPTPLNGSTVSRNFPITDYVQVLYVVVIRDNPSIGAVLFTPNGQEISGAGPGVTVLTDPAYEIFRIELPGKDNWEVDVSGTGLFLMEGLTTSTLGITISGPASDGLAFGLGAQIPVVAQLTNNGQPLDDKDFNVMGTISYSADAGRDNQNFSLDFDTASGTFRGNVIVPMSAPTGSYDIQLTATGTVTGSAKYTSQTRSIQVVLFPAPLFATSSPSGAVSYTSDPVDVSVVQWDAVLRTIYSLPVPFHDRISALPLAGLPAQPDALIQGRVLIGTTPYTKATVTAFASLTSTKGKQQRPIPVTVVNDGNGYFHLTFLPPVAGNYAITLTTTGAPQDSFGNPSTVTRQTVIAIGPSSATQEQRAWLWTGGYALALAILIIILAFYARPAPKYTAIVNPRPGNMTWRLRAVGGSDIGRASKQTRPVARTGKAEKWDGDRKRTERDITRTNIGDWLRWILRRNYLRSNELQLTPGLILRFRRRFRRQWPPFVQRIEIRPVTKRDPAWTDFYGVRLFPEDPAPASPGSNRPKPSLHMGQSGIASGQKGRTLPWKPFDDEVRLMINGAKYLIIPWPEDRSET